MQEITVREMAVKLLESFGLTISPEDEMFLSIALIDARWRIYNLTNLLEIPEGLEGVAAAMAAGEYLSTKKACGQLDGFDLDAAVKSIKEGDTEVSFAVGDGSSTPEQRLDALIAHLTEGRLNEIYRYRRLLW